MSEPQRPAVVKPIAENRRALARYTVEERVEVGVELVGSEVKSLRAGKCELSDAFALVQNGQLQLVNAYIAPYAFANLVRHVEKRPRRLLAHRAEIDRLDGRISQRGYTLIPLRVYFRGPWVKVELGLCKGKESADRREEIKKREGDREARAALSRRRE